MKHEGEEQEFSSNPIQVSLSLLIAIASRLMCITVFAHGQELQEGLAGTGAPVQG